ncbi:Ankyrin repeat [Lishizhenia tianjinensis]|uniref:Ankyrin repeat n=1 Tax=Lishizhenia tianjinensis TaxID=477690 RepID=A0A1I7BKY7_9FLAO|nr:ankyrin repeat domain-containing protein [Lishizhenia tianjinensis]SFT87838.1 Ankyrin repeat [Lishizhenia tianjinensis]
MLDIRTNNTIDVIDKDMKQFASDLIQYAHQGNLLQVKEIIALGADVNIADDSGELALHSAIRSGNDELSLYLLSVGAEPDRLDLTGNNAMHYAAMKNNSVIAERLLEKGANVNGVKEAMVPPLITASLYNCLAIVELLIAKGADIDIKDKKGKTALYYATAQKHQQAMHMLLSAGATPVKVTTNVNGKKPVWKRIFNF